MTKRKPKIVSPALTVRVHAVLVRAVETGVDYGWRRAHKHVEPEKRADEAMACETIAQDVLDSLSEVFSW